VHAPQPELGYRIARFLMTPGHQQRETEALGLLPVRRDIRQEYPILFRMAWMQNILDASYEQIERGTRERPHGSFDELYRRAEVAVLERPDGAPVSLEAVKAAIAEAAHGK
jgi:hypothetical protein